MKLNDVLLEVTMITRDFDSPLKDDDSIRVYHGSDDIDFIYTALTYGVTGDVMANRRYSYEINNNPKGLFVTPDLDTAKEFGGYVLEFHTRIYDLESPVWPGGSFTVQGGISGIFGSNDEREEERLRQRMNWSQSELEFVRNSDRPELAALLISSGERQALFVGDLNRNSIRAVWGSEDPSRVGQQYNRMSPREFIDSLESGGIKGRFGSTANIDHESEDIRKIKQKLVEPREEVTFDTIVDRVSEKRPFLDRDTIENIVRNNPESIRNFVWSDRQFDTILRTM